MKLIVGLGNPGKEYIETRHNVGFLAIDQFAKEKNIQIKKKKFNGVFYKDKNFIIAKPLTYMNNSGNFVYSITKFFNIKNEDVLIIYDDLNFNIGKMVMKPQGSSGGQNGIKDIILQLGTEKIWRIKIGIGQTKEIHKDYVLSNFSKKDLTQINFKKINQAISFFLDGQKNKAATYLNSK